MTIQNDLAKIVLGIVESAGHLKPSARADARLVPDIEAAIAGRIKENREQLLNFMVWWGERGHRNHVKRIEGFMTPEPWTKCQDPLCLSLYGSALDLEKELHPEPVDANPILS